MLRSVVLLSCLMLFGAFASGDPIVGKWSTCGTVKIGDARIELQKKYLFSCPDYGNKWTEMTFDTTRGGRLLFSNCGAGSVTTGTPGGSGASGTASALTYLCASCAGRYLKWSYDSGTSTLAITDSTTVYYLVTSITDSLMVLTKK